MRIDGFVKSWNDERGFGFLQSYQGGQDIFVHIKAFTNRVGRPEVNTRVTFEIEVDANGRKRAKAVQFVRSSALPAIGRHRNASPPDWGTASYLSIPAFLVIYVVVALVWRVPTWIPALYFLASVACYIAYATDKSAAKAGSWRISENNLLLLGMIGGWPGAIVAQQVLRHKSSKTTFREAFWGSVIVNVVLFVLLCSPLPSLILRH